MKSKYVNVYLEAEIRCPQCGRKVANLSPDRAKAIFAGNGFMCVACKVVVEVLLISPTRVVEHRDEAVGEGADATPKILSTED